MRAPVVTFLVALLTVGTAQAEVEQDVLDAATETHELCSALEAIDSDHEVPCVGEACTLPNNEFPRVPDQVLPVHVNIDQCIEDLIGAVGRAENAPADPARVPATAAAG